MTYPTKYSRQFDFASYQNANPTRPLPGDRVNVDLNAVKQSVAETVDFLKTSIRSDGQLMNGIVGRDQLADNIALGFDAPTDWHALTIYTISSTVFHNNIFYKANANHTSGESFDASKWDVIADFSTAVTAAAASADAAAASAASIDGDAAAAAASADAAAVSETNAAVSAEAAADAAAALDGQIQLVSPEQFAAGDDLSADCKPTFDRMIAAGVKSWKGRPGAIYRHVGQLTVPAAGIDFDLNGAMFMPDVTGAVSAIATANYQSSTAFGLQAVNVPAGGDYPIDRVTVTVSPPSADFVVGRDMWLVGAGGSTGGIQPAFFRKIVAIEGDDIIFDKDITSVIYATSIAAWVVKSWIPRFYLRNGIVDCSLMTAPSTLGVLNVEGVEHVDVSGIEFANINFNTSPVGAGNSIVRALRCGDVVVDNNNYQQSTRYGCYAQSTYCRSVKYTRNRGDGEGFGFQVNTTDSASFIGNTLVGRFRSKGNVGSSIRGIKATGIGMSTVIGNDIRDYDSGMKIEDIGGCVITGNTVEFVGTGINLSNQNPAADAVWSGNIVAGNLIRNAAVDGISVMGPGALDIAVTGNVIRNVGLSGIRYNPATGVVANNQIYNWDLNGTGAYPIYQANAAFQGIVEGNRAYHDNPAGKSGFYFNNSGARHYGNICNTDKPYAKVIPPDLVGGLDLGQGVLMKIVPATGISDSSFTTVTFPTPFPNGFLGAFAIASASTPTGFSFQSGTRMQVDVKAGSASSSASLLVLGY